MAPAAAATRARERPWMKTGTTLGPPTVAFPTLLGTAVVLRSVPSNFSGVTYSAVLGK